MANRKTDAERGPLGAWAKRTRDLVDLSAEEVAVRVGTGRPTISKIEGGSMPKPSLHLLRDLYALYLSEAKERGIAIEPPPGLGPEPQAPDADLASALHEIATELRALRQEREEREAMAARLTELEALVASLGEQVRSAPRTGAPRGRGLPLGTGE